MTTRPDPAWRWATIAAILDEMIECAPAERSARLDALCRGDVELRAMVAAVLAHDVPDETPFRAAIDNALDAAALAMSDGAIGQRFGPYRLVSEIGRGGMGSVYLAARDDREFEQQVAIKIVRGLVAPESLRRFRAERQILASLVHPHIARLLDGGTTADGVPYLVMEYVDGVPLDRYCREHRLAVAASLRLFLHVCEAVAHAHRRLIVHRDLKPSNILVTNEGAPKLLDFGIAKLLDTGDADGPDAVALTVPFGQMLTPHYASPEQVRGDPITTATDVYSLGALLYELLTGASPHILRSHRPDEIARVICDEQPPKASAALARGSNGAHGGSEEQDPPYVSDVAQGFSPAFRPRDLAGDLDSIVMTALEKEPSRRYLSVEAFADDIRRHLAGEPVRARPSTWMYRSVRFLRRHRWGAAAAATLVAVLAAWSVTSAVQARRVARERDTALEVTRFLVDLFASSDPAEARSHTVTARELLDRGAKRLSELDGRPEIQARLMDAIGVVYRSLGSFDRSAELMHDSVRIHERIDGPDAPETVAAKKELADALREQGRYDAAEPLYREALAVRTRRLGPRDPSVGQSLNDLSLLLRLRGRHEEAEPLQRQALDIWRESLGPEHPQVAVALMNLSFFAREQAKYDEAERLVREALSIRRAALPDPDPQVANSLVVLGQILNFKGENRAAEPLMMDALDVRRKIYGDDHFLVDITLNNLASLRQDLGDLAGAEPLYRTVLDHRRKQLGRHPDTAVNANNLASLLEERGAYAEAEALYREALDIRRETLGARHAAVARGMHNLARLLLAERKAREAEPLAHDALELRRALLGEAHPETGQSVALVGLIRAAAGHRADGERLLREALAIHRNALAADHPTVLTTTFDLGVLLLDDGRAGEAEPLLRTAAEGRAKRLPDGHWLRAHSDVTLGRALRSLGRDADARPLIESGARILAAALPPDDPRVKSAILRSQR